MAFFSILIADIWQWTPFMTLILYAGLQSLPMEPVEAARIDGASTIQVFRYVKIPLLKSVIAIALILRMMDLFKIFDLVAIITRGGPSGDLTQTITYYIYNIGFGLSLNIGYASAVTIVMLIVVFIVIQRVYRVFMRERSV